MKLRATLVVVAALAAAAAGTVVGPVAPAYAAGEGTLKFLNGSLQYKAAAGEPNMLGVTVLLAPIGYPNTLVFNDTQPIAVLSTRGSYCWHPVASSPGLVYCNPPGVVTVYIDMGEGTDLLSYNGLNTAYLTGGPGNDVIETSQYAGVSTHVAAGDGNDRIYSGLSNDAIDGGAGIDEITYNKSASVYASLQTKTGGRGSETDTYAGIENLRSSWGNDTLIGDDGPNILAGGGGDDQLFGNGGNDRLEGDSGLANVEGQDYVSGGAGDDVIFGDDGADMLFGDAGNDSMNSARDVTTQQYLYAYDFLNGGVGYDSCGVGLIVTNAPNDTAVACEFVYTSFE